MLSRAVTRTALLALSIFALASCSRSLPTFRYRLTVEIETPSGLRSGSSVIEVRTVDRGSGFPGPEAGGIRHQVSGDAVTIKLPDSRYVFALLRDNSTDRTIFRSAAPFWAFDKQLPADRSSYPDVLRALTHVKGKAELPKQHYPLFVIFDDIRRPETIRAIDPGSFRSQLNAEITSVNVEITEDPISTGIIKMFPWASSRMKTMLDGSMNTNSSELANNLSLSDFSPSIIQTIRESR